MLKNQLATTTYDIFGRWPNLIGLQLAMQTAEMFNCGPQVKQRQFDLLQAFSADNFQVSLRDGRFADGVLPKKIVSDGRAKDEEEGH